jgi:hypothetical protein
VQGVCDAVSCASIADSFALITDSFASIADSCASIADSFALTTIASNHVNSEHPRHRVDGRVLCG